MPRRRKKIVSIPDEAAAAGRLAKALAKLKKAELIDVIVELASADRGVMRRLEAELDVAAPPQELVAVTRQAIADATAVDERQINDDFDYDPAAYDAVERKAAVAGRRAVSGRRLRGVSASDDDVPARARARDCGGDAHAR